MYTLDWRTKIDGGDLIHVYVFYPDTLAKYTWEEIVIHKKYWFQEVKSPYVGTAIDFPGEFQYMGDN
jgi:hypothetical protein